MKSPQPKNNPLSEPAHSSFFQKERKDTFFGEGNKPKSFLSSPTIQPKLTVGQQDDVYEKEADSTANKVVQQIHSSNAIAQPVVQRKCATCEEEEKIQKKEIEGGQAAPIPAPAPAATASATAQPQPGRLIVDDITTPGEGQMRKSVFFERLNGEVCSTVDSAMAGTPFSSSNCPYIRAAFARYRNSSPFQLEQVLARYAPMTAFAQSADGLIQIVKMKVAVAAVQWLAGGGTPDIPENQPAGSGLLQNIGSGIGSLASGIGSMSFKANEGGANATQSPAAVMQSLGKGNSIDGSSKGKMESAFGTNFSDVEVHTDNKAASLASGMNARAFAVGNHIAFGSGEHKPGTLVGDALMAHELAHTVQQSDTQTSGTQTKGSEYNALEEDADSTAVNVMTKLHGREDLEFKDRVKKGLKTGLTISRCRDKPTPTPGPPPPGPAPAPDVPAEFQITGLPENTAARTGKIFFNRNKDLVPPGGTEDLKLDHIVATNAATNVDLHGYKSEDENTANLETLRINRVSTLLGTKGHTGTRNPMAHAGAGSGVADYREMRAVEIKPSGVSPHTPNCIDPISGLQRDGYTVCTPASQFTTAQTRAGVMLTRAISALNVSAVTPVARGGLTRFFGANPASTASVAATVRANLVMLKSHILTQMAPLSTLPAAPGGDPGPGHLCGDECHNTCNGTIAYNSGQDAAATMVLCKLFMDDPDLDSRSSTLIHEGLHGITLTGVTTLAGNPTNAHDYTYDWQRLINFLDTPTALKNNDSYVLLVQQIMNPGTVVEAGQPAGSRDIITGVTPGSVEEKDIKVVIGYMESWFEKTDQDLSSLYGTIGESIIAGSWTNGYYEMVMERVALHFGFTRPPAVPTAMEKFNVSGISSRISRIRNTFSQQLSISRSAAPATVWSAGPGITVTLGVDFFAAGSRRAKLDLLILKIIEANTDISAAHRTHYAQIVNELRTLGERGSP